MYQDTLVEKLFFDADTSRTLARICTQLAVLERKMIKTKVFGRIKRPADGKRLQAKVWMTIGM